MIGEHSICGFCGMTIVQTSATEWLDQHGSAYHEDSKKRTSVHYPEGLFGQAPYDPNLSAEDLENVRKSLEKLAER